MARIASLCDPGPAYEKCLIVHADSEQEALALAEAEASLHGWFIVRRKESPMGCHYFLCATSQTTKPYPPGF